jgi:hypothetical protein
MTLAETTVLFADIVGRYLLACPLSDDRFFLVSPCHYARPKTFPARFHGLV